jgi:hypothetical protein
MSFIVEHSLRSEDDSYFYVISAVIVEIGVVRHEDRAWW